MDKTIAASCSAHLFCKAEHYIPGGVNSPVRAFKSVGGIPLFFSSANGAYLIDADHQSYIDYVGSWGPMILGHAHPRVIAAVQQTAEKGLSFGAPCEWEVELAMLICQLMPAIEKVRFVSSGTEATMTAIRLARGITMRDKILKFAGCYHGHSDSLLVNAGSGALTLGVPSSPGVTKNTAADTLVAEFNNMDSVEHLFAQYPDSIAAIIVEPIPGNMNMILPHDHFLGKLREICDRYQALLIIDEVMTGFRVALGGAQSLYGITPDLTTLGKIIGGGMPVGAVGGLAKWMDHLAPLGPVYQAGTLSGNPIAMAAGIATLKEIQRPNFYTELSTMTRKLTQGLNALAKQHHIAFHADSVGGMFGLYFTERDSIRSLQEMQQSNITSFKRFFHGMLQQHIYFAPSAFEAGFVSIAHQHPEITTTLAAAERVFALLK
ncbi:MAG: glutamate-1-semialdehyde-2,1-aminomutase [Coxiella sp. RIFCSPHIGHO2_12_FULL_42_15]|nr:MAG: glutamate-1-semialdehyde-2,1-aminomutase [Coxiella sp. RIFCSPHIGHO2_12_FULL_42_15]